MIQGFSCIVNDLIACKVQCRIKCKPDRDPVIALHLETLMHLTGQGRAASTTMVWMERGPASRCSRIAPEASRQSASYVRRVCLRGPRRLPGPSGGELEPQAGCVPPA